jgi:hemolysin III
MLIDQDIQEERANFLTHALGLILSVAGASTLMWKVVSSSDQWNILAALLFSLSLVMLYTASTLYHGVSSPELKRRMKIFDHCAIYCLIAGSYTPFTLVTLRDSIGWTLFFTVWSTALLGIFFKLYFTGRFRLFSTMLYLGMGWLILIAQEPLREALPIEAVTLIFAGGLSYTFGSLIYLAKWPQFHHAIWHLFVMAGSAFHYLTIYQYVL